ncbi:MAG: hypothetical protein M1819_007357 [Sarea resinae]|nr:MAG: hypothetical protein M1819_007357 [Sarea resinae]
MDADEEKIQGAEPTLHINASSLTPEGKEEATTPGSQGSEELDFRKLLDDMVDSRSDIFRTLKCAVFSRLEDDVTQSAPV